jgi:Butirosin biosynthesis protein H, N-terminal
VSRTVTAPPPEVAALARALPDSLVPDVLFGIGGGCGFGRFVYGETVTVLTRITTRETAKEGFLASICNNLQVRFRLAVASSPDALRDRLRGELAQDRTPVVWVEPDRLPWAGPPAAYHAVAVLELDGQATVYDGEERSLPEEALLAATRTSGTRHRMLVADGGHGDVGSAVRAGLAAHREQMREGFGPQQTRSRFGLSGLARWTVDVAEDAGRGESLADQIERRGGGPGMREAQSAFLAYAGHERAAAAASAAAARWGELAAALRGGYAGPDHVRAVHDAEAEALAGVEAALRGG